MMMTTRVHYHPGCGNHMGKSSACESSTREIRAVEATQKRSLFVRTRDGRRIVAYDLDSVGCGVDASNVY